jgi:predicted RNA-binding Zn-ribbon protein involved in translation (DUF1610 family)
MTIDDIDLIEPDDSGISITKLSPELIQAATYLPLTVAADLVRTYYGVQEHRLKIDNQIRATRTLECPDCGESLKEARAKQPLTTREFTCTECGYFGVDEIDATAAIFVREAIAAGEERAKNLLDYWTSKDELANWSRQVMGIGPVLAAGLRAEIDVTRANHVSSVWRFAGYDPTAIWEKGQKRPHNAFLKVICWRLGDSFVKVSGRPKSLYGKLYRNEKNRLVHINDNGGFAQDAKERIDSGIRVPGKGTEARKALDAGRLPQAQVDLRARRKAVKIFLSHYWVQGRLLEGLSVSQPYAIARLGHVTNIGPEVPYIIPADWTGAQPELESRDTLTRAELETLTVGAEQDLTLDPE